MAVFSRKLCTDIEKLCDDDSLRQPVELLVEAVYNNNEPGSATCVILTLDTVAPVLYTAAIGDSGYMILRKSGLDLTTAHRSREQQHSFNFPYQVGTGGDNPTKAKKE